MNMPLISVIVPIYSTDRYTGMCIESIINQTYKNLEIILVDDGSIDRCPELCDLYGSKDKRIKVIHKPNGGLVSSRKIGMQAATGDYIGYVDGDDWIAKGYYENIFHEIEKNNPDVVVCNWVRAFFDQHVVIRNNLDDGYYSGDSLEQLKKQMISKGSFYKPGISTYVWNKVFRKDIVYDCQMNVDDRLMTGEDACVSYAAILKSNSVSIINNPSYFYRQHEDSMLKRKSNYPLEIERMNALFNNLCSISSDNDNLLEQIEDYVLSCCIIRTGGIDPYNGESIFGENLHNRKLAIYGAGSFGQLFVSKLLENNVGEIVAWLDDDYWEYRRSGLNVDPVDQLRDCEYDYFIIATTDGDLSEAIIQRVRKYGVYDEKVVKLKIAKDDRHSLLMEYLYGGIV